jgi:hypothetical protein
MIRLIKSRRMRPVTPVACTGRDQEYIILAGKPKRKSAEELRVL